MDCSSTLPSTRKAKLLSCAWQLEWGLVALNHVADLWWRGRKLLQARTRGFNLLDVNPWTSVTLESATQMVQELGQAMVLLKNYPNLE